MLYMFTKKIILGSLIGNFTDWKENKSKIIRIIKMIVMKFGGTSVGNADRIANVAGIVKNNLHRRPVVVVSAVTKITDALIKLANECSQGHGDDTPESIKKIHHEILEKLNLDKEIIRDDLHELEQLAKKMKSSGKLDNKDLDHFQSFGEQISSKIMAAQLNEIGVESKAFNAWDIGFLTDAEFG